MIYGNFPTDEQEKVIKAFLEALDISFVKDDGQEDLPAHVLAGIKRGEEDIKAGRFTTYEDFKKKLRVGN